MRQSIARLTRFAVRLLLAGGAALSMSGCRLAPDPATGCRIVNASAHHDEVTGDFVVTLLLGNSTDRTIDLRDLRFELTTFDSSDIVIEENAPITIRIGEIARFDTTTLRLHKADGERRIHHAHLVMKDRSGRVLAQWPLGEPESTAHVRADHRTGGGEGTTGMLDRLDRLDRGAPPATP